MFLALFGVEPLLNTTGVCILNACVSDNDLGFKGLPPGLDEPVRQLP